ncbi:heat-inducible transcriptional repressor HrcA [Parachlamydia sp. AcF125]|uniref:heat-inducible transcriptional repressor HrcA n=1 Tax=Parachlamydia sp. AcF125 TaxID=2795736 RepID=UPI001BC9C361|nr:Heat-inducible transcription repressor HrcA [Parachlamydia sp. AcF125]
MKVPATSKKGHKSNRERQVLLGLVEYYLNTGKPVGSHTLQGAGFENISSATIRNYFANLEQEGYLSQQHTSSGRVPTNKALRLYTEEYLNSAIIAPEDEKVLQALRQVETREIASYLQYAAETLSQLSNQAVFLSAPRFDQDYLVELKLVSIDHSRCLCILVTGFGIIQTEVLYVNKKLNAFTIKRLELYFHWRLTGFDKPTTLNKEEELLGQTMYNELMVRYIVGYSNFTDEEVYRTGFSKLATHADYQTPAALAINLALFEDAQSMRLLLRDCVTHSRLKVWIGEDLLPFSSEIPTCSVLAIPYRINQHNVGAIGILGPVQMPYRRLFGILKVFSEYISETLTRHVFRFKLSFRQPHRTMSEKELPPLNHASFLLEDRR